MSQNTLNLLKKQVAANFTVRTLDSDAYASLFGIPVAVCNKLELGVMDFIEHEKYSNN